MEFVLSSFRFAPLADLAMAGKTAVQWAFFKLIFEFLDGEIEAFRDNVLGQTLEWASAVVLAAMTAWVLLQGFRIATGRSREPMMGLVMNTLRSVVIVTAATTFTFGASHIHTVLTTDLPAEINYVVSGKSEEPAESIDDNLTLMQAAMAGIDLMATDDPSNKEDKDRALLMTGIGVAGPSVIGGALLLMYKIALALVVGLGPLFILCLLFEQTRALFARWIQYGIGTIFSMCVLSFMSAVAMKMTFAVATAFAAQYALALATHSTLPDGINSMALQQGGLGLLLSILLLTAPPMAAQFFQGTLGSFSSYSMFGVTGRDAESYARHNRPALPRSSGSSGLAESADANPMTMPAMHSPRQVASDNVKRSSRGPI